MRLLFVSPAQYANPRGGRALLAKLHHDALVQLLGDGFREHRLGEGTVGLGGRIGGYIDGATPTGIAATIEAINLFAADVVWLDGSNLGRIAQAIKLRCPNVRVITFCHNVEARFFWGSLRARPGARAAAILVANYIAERIAVRNSSSLVCLSSRDSEGLQRLYGRGADAIAPMVLADLGSSAAGTGLPQPKQPYGLFVGGDFYANVAGVRWFAREVAPRIDMHFYVIGRGMEALRAELEAGSGVRVVGGVDDLAPWYSGATVAVAPIFDGSGMKTKVAEALMFGKHVMGTPEAFSGYTDDVVRSNWCCDDADAFVAAITQLSECPVPAYDPAMRALYERDHSPAAARAVLSGILGIDHTSAR